MSNSRGLCWIYLRNYPVVDPSSIPIENEDICHSILSIIWGEAITGSKFDQNYCSTHPLYIYLYAWRICQSKCVSERHLNAIICCNRHWANPLDYTRIQCNCIASVYISLYKRRTMWEKQKSLYAVPPSAGSL